MPVNMLEEEEDEERERDTFMTQKRTRTTKTLTCGWSHAAERPRPGGRGDPEILVQVKLSNRELMHSLGISCQRGETCFVFLSLKTAFGRISDQEQDYR